MKKLEILQRQIKILEIIKQKAQKREKCSFYDFEKINVSKKYYDENEKSTLGEIFDIVSPKGLDKKTNTKN